MVPGGGESWQAECDGLYAEGGLPNEDGYELWLRYPRLGPARARHVACHSTALVFAGDSDCRQAARREIVRGLAAMTGDRPRLATEVDGDGIVLCGTPVSSPVIRSLALPLSELGTEGYLIRSLLLDGQRAIVVAANTDLGLLYGSFALLRCFQLEPDLSRLDVASAPRLALRLLNHWDNLDRTVERGYAGFSIWDWWTLPDYVRPIYRDYARANAAIGINGTVLNNVNASPDMLRGSYIAKAAKLAEVFRPYGIRVYLSVNFASPKALGGLPTADPLDEGVRAWWRAKADEIYALIPDFGGLLIKANSEGQPGPQDYGRSHADGANVIADALAGHGGVVMWRAFVYSPENGADRVAQAFSEFEPLDGAFRDNVVLQVKNGPLDFQPREPFSPLFGAMKSTPLLMEFQITKEYLGQATHLAYLGPLFETVLKADTGARTEEATVADVLEGKVFPQAMTGMAGVANIGTDRDWTGGVFNQANWFVLGRLAWDPRGDARQIAREWARLTFAAPAEAIENIVEMMMLSTEAVENYMAPLGLHHQMATSHHYGPGPWVDDLSRDDWNPVYYARADEDGIGFDRTETGSRAILQYAPSVRAAFADPRSIDEGYLLWFHRLPWDFMTRSGQTLWDRLVERYDLGVRQVAEMQATWRRLKPYIDDDRHNQVEAFLTIQAREAKWWRDACIAFFRSFARRPLPAGHAEPEHDLTYYKSLEFPRAPGI